VARGARAWIGPRWSRGLAGLAAAVVHPLAVVDQGARLAEGVSVGPFAVVGPGARLGKGTVLHEHCVVKGDTEIGEHCEIFPYSVVGAAPQDRKHDKDVAAKVRLGDRCVVREHATINGGSSAGEGVTSIGDSTLILTAAHVGHDCRIGKGVVVSNLVQLAGHVHIGDFAVIGGAVSLRQFVNVGRLAMIGGASAVDKHVLPYSLVLGNRATLDGVNIVGLRRKRVPYHQIKQLKVAFQTIREARLGGREDLASIVENLSRATAENAHHEESGLASLAEIYDFILGNAGRTNGGSVHEELYTWDPPRRRLGLTL
jgi:UDP-N-acetylglucosamine acyltransferase